MSEQLPDGLDLAVEMIATHVEGEVYGRSLTPSALLKKRQGVAAIAAIKSEHAQRVTLQHHAADLAQRVADLEAERDEWKQNARNVMDADLVQRAALEQERELRELRARLAEIEAQEPVDVQVRGSNPRATWMRPDATKTEPTPLERAEYLCKNWPKRYSMRLLYSLPVPAQAVPDGWKLVPKKLTKEMRSALVQAAREYMQEYGGNSPEVMYEAAVSAAPEHTA